MGCNDSLFWLLGIVRLEGGVLGGIRVLNDVDGSVVGI